MVFLNFLFQVGHLKMLLNVQFAIFQLWMGRHIKCGISATSQYPFSMPRYSHVPSPETWTWTQEKCAATFSESLWQMGKFCKVFCNSLAILVHAYTAAKYQILPVFGSLFHFCLFSHRLFRITSWYMHRNWRIGLPSNRTSLVLVSCNILHKVLEWWSSLSLLAVKAARMVFLSAWQLLKWSWSV